jgi:hypothetical protein
MKNLVIAMLIAAIAVMLLCPDSAWAKQDTSPGPNSDSTFDTLDKGSPQVDVSPYDNVDWDIYVRNKPLTSAVIRRGYVFAPFDAVMSKLQFGYTQGDDGVVHITSSPGSYPVLRSSGNSLRCEYNGTNFTIGAAQSRGSVYVPLRKLCNSVGATFIANKSTNIIDIVVPQGMSDKEFQKAHQQAVLKGMNQQTSSGGQTTTGTQQTLDKTGGSTASGTAATMDKTDGGTSTSQTQTLDKGSGSLPDQKAPAEVPPAGGKADESPIKQVGEIGGFADVSTGQCYWNATVKNTGDQVVKNVVVTLHIADGTGKDYSTQIKPIGNMNPGDQTKVDFYWQGMKYLIVNPKIEIKHDPLPKKEETPATKAMPPKASPKQAPASK